MTTEVEARLEAANPLPREQVLDQLYGPDMTRRLLFDIRAKREGRMTDTTDRRQPDTPQANEGDMAKLVPQPAASSRARTGWIVAAAAIVVLAVGIVAALVMLNTRNPDVAGQPDPVTVAGQFASAYAIGDVEQAATYLGADADPSILSGGDSDPLEKQFEEARRSKNLLGSCEEVGPDPRGTMVECDYTYHDFRSDEIGRGPFGAGSTYRVYIKDGAVADFEDQHMDEAFNNPNGFSRQVWEPFAEWVGQNHPDAVDILYDPYPAGWRITQESVPLWDQYLDEWVAELNQGS
jgi:hypothetical protein